MSRPESPNLTSSSTIHESQRSARTQSTVKSSKKRVKSLSIARTQIEDVPKVYAKQPRQQRSRGMVSPPTGRSTASQTTGTSISTGDQTSQTVSMPPSQFSSDTSLMGDRGRWANKQERILSLVALVVGFGNIWRFPYLCLAYGGGAFLYPYLLFHLLLGVPVIYMELLLGQYSNMGPIGVFANIAPIFQGLGWAVIVVNFLQSIYYNVLMAWAAFFLFDSVGYSDLLWKTCKNKWNTVECFSTEDDNACAKIKNHSFFFKLACHNDSESRAARDQAFESNALHPSSYDLYYNFMYNSSDTQSSLGTLEGQWHISLLLLLCWFITAVCVIRSIRSFGIIVYFTTSLPMLVLVALTIYGFTLDHASDGIKFFLTPDPVMIADPYVWAEAAIQVLKTSAPATGTLITLGGYNQFDVNSLRDTFIMLGVNVVASLLCGFQAFSVLGYLAQFFHISDIAHFVKIGENVAFVAYAQGMAELKGVVGPAFSVLFFVAVITFGLDSQFIQVESIVVAICDQWPILLRRRWTVVVALGVVLFAFGLPMCTTRGFYAFSIMSAYAKSISIIYLALLEVICVIFVYGWRRFARDIQCMMGPPRSRLSRWLGPGAKVWIWLWFALTGPLLLMLTATRFIDTPKFHNDKTTVYLHDPGPHAIFGWFLSFLPLMVIVMFGAVRIVYQLLDSQPQYKLWRPTDQWCPVKERPVKTKTNTQIGEGATATLDLENETVSIVLKR